MGRKKIHLPPFKRNCPKCSIELIYNNFRNLDRAIKNNSVCNKCAIRMNDIIAKKISNALMGRSHIGGRGKQTRLGPWCRKCPVCNGTMYYSSKWALSVGERDNTICNSCSSKIYKKSWTYIIKDEHIKKMAAKKAGFDTYQQYMDNLEVKKKYYREVRKITRKQNLTQLENYGKLIGLNGVPDAYQVDHIISIDEGFHKNIAPDIIGHITNLRIIPWKENLLKSNKNGS